MHGGYGRCVCNSTVGVWQMCYVALRMPGVALFWKLWMRESYIVVLQVLVVTCV